MKTRQQAITYGLTFPHTYVAVSYTHLDVYKRQVPVSSVNGITYDSM